MSERLLVSIVDDDESVRESLPDLLREFGYAAKAFSSAEEFLASDCIGRTRCLILDIAMPGMSGPDLQRELKVRGHEIPIIFITANQAARLRVLEQGAVECLNKPFSDAALLGALQAAFRVKLNDASSPFRTCEIPANHMKTAGATTVADADVRSSHMAHAVPIVFVVDDDISVRESLELLIRNAGWQPELFETAQEFLSRQRVAVPNCLVLDVTLPGLNGIDLQKQVARESHRHAYHFHYWSR